MKNKNLANFIEFLDSLKFSGKASVCRSLLKKELVEKFLKNHEVEIEMVEAFEAWEDKGKGLINFKNPDFKDAHQEWADTLVDVDVAKLPFLEVFKQSVIDYPYEFGGNQADMYLDLFTLVGDENDELQGNE